MAWLDRSATARLRAPRCEAPTSAPRVPTTIPVTGSTPVSECMVRGLPLVSKHSVNPSSTRPTGLPMRDCSMRKSSSAWALRVHIGARSSTYSSPTISGMSAASG